MSINLAKCDLLSIAPPTLAEYYMHRASVYEAIGLLDHSRRDLHSILEADPNFVQRYHAQAIQLEENG